ncbi:MAG: cell division protein SepF [Clostridia bacterium]|nr:cell division protein SepF [Clostridia bacterium]
MGLFDWFKKKRDYDEDDEEYEDENEGKEVEASVSLEGALELKICKPKTFDQMLDAVDYLLLGRTVLLNLEGVEKTLYRRMIDFISGAAYALGVTIKKATNDSFLIAPREVDVSGEVFDGDAGDEEFFTV